MARSSRTKSSSKTYHIMIRGVNKQAIFLDEQDNKMFINILLKSKEKFAYSIYAYVLMKNHVHLEIMDNDMMSKIIHFISSSYAMYFNSKYDRVGHLFQDRYKSKPIENQRYLLTLLRYIHQNPEKAGICATDKYRWSSYKNYINGWNKIVDIDYILNLIDNNNEKAIGEFERLNNSIVKLESKDILEFEMRNKLKDNELEKIIMEIIGKREFKDFSKYNKTEKEKIINKLKDIKGTNATQIAKVLNTNKKTMIRIFNNK